MSGADALPWFLQRLALDGSADQRAIRRAYAREVKRIDQGADAEGFQQLREAYETALRWEQYQRYYARAEAEADAAPGAPLPAMPAADAPETPERAPAAAQEHVRPSPDSPPLLDLDPLQIDPQQLSADVFEAFMAGCSGLAQGRTLHDSAAWEQHLRTCLHDDRLVNLAARGIFEARIVHLLASGWRNGHETLLEAAADVFEWRRDRHRLRQFGHAGAIVDRAIDERSMFDNQDRDQKTAQRQVIARLRESDVPESGQLRADMPHVEQMAMRFPTWLELVASMDNVELWRTAYAALPDELKQPVAAAEEAPPPAAAKPGKIGWVSAGSTVFWLLLLTAALRFIHHAVDLPGTHGTPAVATNKPGAGQALTGPRTEQQRKIEQQLRAAGAAQVEKYSPPSAERLEEIRSRIRYRVTQMETPGQYTVKFKVQLDKQGRIEHVVLHKASGLPLYDATVEKAIRNTPPFPTGTSPQFVLSYGLEIISRPAGPAHEPANSGETGAPPTPPQ
ncbi:hypothetical protein GCM10027277_05110 [Pseudoduganella ginsengisoli]|uniref:TonB family protein n=1 Tax=Pseudoduganella ginsengisoli TaxID=1462440 RepID=A0A6L6Q4G9_9BURK|nr:TonB C-terminal domain-containing protein [Pseudoduganella ginsengisoli]MTW04211.1 hypothetical protein [Pseudoduganella ginsengisoli]